MDNLLDITAIVLTYNEEIHIRRCLDNLTQFAREVWLIDSYSTDATLDIARTYDRVHVLQNKWENNHSRQFNWGLTNARIKTQWVLRLDADEYLLPELISELRETLPSMPDDVTGIEFNRRHIFMNRWMRRGFYPTSLLRLFRHGHGRCEDRLMDEHIELTDGRMIHSRHDFCDHNLNEILWFCHKHVNYAVREAVDILDIELNLTGSAETDDTKQLTEQALAKRKMKHKYARQPLFWRSFAYFVYRYFFKGAILEGREGFVWTFIQGWWYRTLVDAKIFEIKKACGTDREKIKTYLRDRHNIVL